MGRSSHPEIFCIKIALNCFTKFTGNHQCQGNLLFFHGQTFSYDCSGNVSDSSENSLYAKLKSGNF